jgi:hypothetical protein
MILEASKTCPERFPAEIILRNAIKASRSESVELALRWKSPIRYSDLSLATQPQIYDGEVFDVIVSHLVSRRKRLQQLAENSLPANILKRFHFPPNKLLDYHANEVCQLLRSYKIPVTKDLHDDSHARSVFDCINNNVLAAKTLYNAGFTILSHRDRLGRPTLFNLKIEYDLGPSYFDMCQWVISILSQADDPQLTRDLLPVHQISTTIGKWFLPCACFLNRGPKHYPCSRFQSHFLQSFSECGLEGNGGLIKMLLSDGTTRDTCSCACSGNGCLPSTSLFNAYFRYLRELTSPELTLSSLFQFIDVILGRDGGRPYYYDKVAPVIIRLGIFNELELSHTCCASSTSEPPQPLNITDALQIQAEEIEGIGRLESLSAELTVKYFELGVPLPEFLNGYYRTRIEELRSESAEFDEEVAQKMREVGVIMNER